jgi:hypothetical protein
LLPLAAPSEATEAERGLVMKEVTCCFRDDPSAASSKENWSPKLLKRLSSSANRQTFLDCVGRVAVLVVFLVLVQMRKAGAPAVGHAEYITEGLCGRFERFADRVLSSRIVVEYGLRPLEYEGAIPQLIRLNIVSEPGQHAVGAAVVQKAGFPCLVLPRQKP